MAAECVVAAKTKAHLNWERLSEVAEALQGKAGKALQAAYQQVEDEEDEHLYHTTGWSRELWMASLGLPAVLPPPEEAKEVKTAIGVQDRIAYPTDRSSAYNWYPVMYM